VKDKSRRRNKHSEFGHFNGHGDGAAVTHDIAVKLQKGRPHRVAIGLLKNQENFCLTSNMILWSKMGYPHK